MRNVKWLKREITRWMETDVLVVGGSPTGVAAAVSAAREGARVMLVEQLGILGGQTTAGLVFTPGDRLFDDEGRRLVGGFAQELIDRACAGSPKDAGWPDNGTTPWGENWIWPPAMQFILADFLDEGGVDVILHAKAAGALVEGNVLYGVVFIANGQTIAVRAKVTIDATGDAEVAALAGARCTTRAVEQRRAPGVHSVLACVDIGRFVDFVQSRKYKVRYAPDVPPNRIRERIGEGIGFSIIGLHEFFEEGIRSSDFHLLNDIYVGPGLISLRDDLVQTYWISSLNIDVLDPLSLTKAELDCRRQLRILLDYYRKCAPGFEESYPILTPSTIGRRESRQIAGTCTITENDLRANRVFADAVGASLGHDDHGKSTSSHDIPYCSLVPEKTDGLLVAGRCISADAVAQNSIRGILPCIVSGQGAGVAAALAVKTHLRPRDIDIARLQERLAAQHVVVHRHSTDQENRRTDEQ